MPQTFLPTDSILKTATAGAPASPTISPTPSHTLGQPTLQGESTPHSNPSTLEPPTLEGKAIRHILLGSAGNVRQTIHLLHTLRYVENALWSPLVPIPNDRLIITPQQGEVMSILVKHL